MDLARGLDPLPDAEVADDPGEQEAQGQLPAQGPQVMDAIRDLQDPPPGERRLGWAPPLPLASVLWPTCLRQQSHACRLSSKGSSALFAQIHKALLCPEMGIDSKGDN